MKNFTLLVLAISLTAMAQEEWKKTNAISATEFCNSTFYSSSDRMECWNSLKQKSYQPRTLNFCANFTYNNKERLECIRYIAGKFFDSEEISFCNNLSYNSKERFECVKSATWSSSPDFSVEFNYSANSNIGYQDALEHLETTARESCRNYRYYKYKPVPEKCYSFWNYSALYGKYVIVYSCPASAQCRN